MRINKKTEARLTELRGELAGVQRASLVASRTGDYMRVARLTTMANALSRSIMETDGILSADLF